MKNVNGDPPLPRTAPHDPTEPRGLLERRHHQPNQRPELPRERILEIGQPLYLAEEGSAHVRKEILQSQRPGETPSRAEGLCPALTQSQEQVDGTQGRGGHRPTWGNGSRPTGLEGTVSRQSSQAKLKDLCRNLKMPIIQRDKTQNAQQPSNIIKHEQWGNRLSMRRKSVGKTAPDVRVSRDVRSVIVTTVHVVTN